MSRTFCRGLEIFFRHRATVSAMFTSDDPLAYQAILEIQVEHEPKIEVAKGTSRTLDRNLKSLPWGFPR